jgi:hypothetical protein
VPHYLALLNLLWQKISTTLKLFPLESFCLLFLRRGSQNLYKHLSIFAMQPGIIHHRRRNSKRNPLPFGLQVGSALCWIQHPPNPVTTYHTTPMQSVSSFFISTDGPITTTKPCSIRHITARVGAAVVRAAVAEDLAEGCCDVGPRELGSMSEVRRYIG